MIALHSFPSLNSEKKYAPVYSNEDLWRLVLSCVWHVLNAMLEFGSSRLEVLKLARRRPIERLVNEPTNGSGDAQVVDTLGQLAHILWAASRGELGKRNVAMIWMLFGSGLRINEVAQLKVEDAFYESGELKKNISIPAKYTKTSNPRAAYILVPAQREAIEV